MKTQKEIEKKLKELDELMAKLTPSDIWNVASIDSQRYILQWILDRL